MYNNLSRNILLNHGGLSRNCLIESINANSNVNDVNNNNIDQGLNLIKKVITMIWTNSQIILDHIKTH